MTLFCFPLIFWVVGFFTGFWFDSVISFGFIVMLYAGLFTLFSVVPVWLSSVLFALLGCAGALFFPDLSLDMSSKYILVFIGIFLFIFGHYFTLKKNISITPIVHTLTSLSLIALNRPGMNPFWTI